MRRYSAAVVGLGNIGMRMDLNPAAGGRVTSHARAFADHPGYRLAAGIDPDAGSRTLFEQNYRVPAFPDVAAMLAAGIRPEVYSIAVPTPLHARTHGELAALHPAAILCEKPLADRVADAERMLGEAAAAGCALAVNYMRRCDPGVLSLRQLIVDSALGEIYKGCAWYSKGLLNNGSHLVDLLSYLLGEAGEFEVLHAGRKWDGHDPEPDVCMCFGQARVVLLAAREECFSHNGFELIGSRATVRYADGGHRIEIRAARADPVLPGYRILATEPQVIVTDLKRYQWNAVDNLYHHLTEGAPLHSDGASALGTLRAIDRIRAALGKLQGGEAFHERP